METDELVVIEQRLKPGDKVIKVPPARRSETGEKNKRNLDTSGQQICRYCRNPGIQTTFMMIMLNFSKQVDYGYHNIIFDIAFPFLIFTNVISSCSITAAEAISSLGREQEPGFNSMIPFFFSSRFTWV